MERMKKNRNYGPALYFASDKNVFDALVQKHKVDSATIAQLFRNRNTIVSKKTERDDLAEHFSRLTHDYYDHKIISSKLGVAPRRERATTVELVGDVKPESVQAAVEELKKQILKVGDVAKVTRNGDDFILEVQYSRYDYKKSEFSQLVVKDAVIDIRKTDLGYTIVAPQNEFVNGLRDDLANEVEAKSDQPVEKFTVSLFHVSSPKSRTEFFIELMSKMNGFSRRDVTDVYVYKPKPVKDSDEDLSSDDDETHIEKVLLRGNGVTRSSILQDLVGADDYYIVKICWLAKRIMGNGDVYKMEASFADPKNCEGFSVLLKTVYPNIDNKFIKYRPPMGVEIEELTRIVEAAAKSIVQTHTGSK
ncbi:hypothetical protein IFU03_10750 [Pseudomonas fluorescens]|uniref:Uncharacterized protein n=2 Tax=Pseudomonas fluorescens TaxID=294 RepID=A0AAE2U4K3_PSEFL|nr:hypothetical protein [Pseudomonas fluorescens]